MRTRYILPRLYPHDKGENLGSQASPSPDKSGGGGREREPRGRQFPSRLRRGGGGGGETVSLSLNKKICVWGEGEYFEVQLSFYICTAFHCPQRFVFPVGYGRG